MILVVMSFKEENLVSLDISLLIHLPQLDLPKSRSCALRNGRGLAHCSCSLHRSEEKVTILMLLKEKKPKQM